MTTAEEPAGPDQGGADAAADRRAIAGLVGVVLSGLGLVLCACGAVIAAASGDGAGMPWIYGGLGAIAFGIGIVGVVGLFLPTRKGPDPLARRSAWASALDGLLGILRIGQ